MFACKGFHRKFKFSRHVPPTKVKKYFWVRFWVSLWGGNDIFHRNWIVRCRQTASREIGLLIGALAGKSIKIKSIILSITVEFKVFIVNSLDTYYTHFFALEFNLFLSSFVRIIGLHVHPEVLFQIVPFSMRILLWISLKALFLVWTGNYYLFRTVLSRIFDNIFFFVEGLLSIFVTCLKKQPKTWGWWILWL